LKISRSERDQEDQSKLEELSMKHLQEKTEMETKIKSIKHQLIDEKNQREIAVDKVMELNM